MLAHRARCQAGQYLHDIGIIHGDLSCNNVLLKTKPQYSGGTGPEVQSKKREIQDIVSWSGPCPVVDLLAKVHACSQGLRLQGAFLSHASGRFFSLVLLFVRA